MDDYITGTVKQLLCRAKHLTERVPTLLSPELAPLLVSCQTKIAQITADLQWLLDEPALLLPGNQPARFRALRRSVGELDLVETQGIAALERSHDDDLHLNQLLARICEEVKYPLARPVVTTLSQAYFRIIPELNLLCVPLSEARFLLHLPDLFHEIAHPLLVPPPTLATVAFQHAMAHALLAALDYLGTEARDQGRSRGPEQRSFVLSAWTQSWQSWAVELMCDLFAALTVGPAFGWAHLHLSAKRGRDPFEVPRLVPTSHPPDAARMEAVLRALALIGFQAEAGQVQDRWNRFLTVAGFRAEPEYRRCFPPALLEKVCDAALQGVTAGNCRIAGPKTSDTVFVLLNDAWREFWRAPDTYDAWELQAVESLRRAA
jgi:hypothetical protein